jgi:hypothetical protein
MHSVRRARWTTFGVGKEAIFFDDKRINLKIALEWNRSHLCRSKRIAEESPGVQVRKCIEPIFFV